VQTSSERPFERYYFLTESDYTSAKSTVEQIGGH
jgi:hypothetical protein